MAQNEDYLLRSILNTQRFLDHLNMVIEERKVWNEEIDRLELLRSERLMQLRSKGNAA